MALVEHEGKPSVPGPHPLGWMPLAAGAWMLVFGAYEVAERTWLAGAPGGLLYALHILRGTLTSFLLAGLVAWWMLRRGGAGARFVQNLLEKLHERDEQLQEAGARISLEQAKTIEVLRHVEAAMVLMGPGDRIDWASPKAYEWFGEDLCGWDCHRRLWDDPRPCDGCGARSGPSFPCERTLSSRGHGRTFLVQCSPLDSRDGQRLGIIQDITRIKQMQAEVIHAGQLAAIGQLAAGVAHEVNNPLASVASSVELLAGHSRRGYPDSESAAADLRLHLGRVEKNVYRCKRVIDNLLSFAHRPEDALERVDLEKVLADVRDLVAATARSRRVRLELPDGGEEGPLGHKPSMVLAASSGHSIQSIAVNLLLNAIDASAEDDRVALEAMPMSYASFCRSVRPEPSALRPFDPSTGSRRTGRGALVSPASRESRSEAGREDGGVLLAFRDTGHGMSAEVQERAFEPFFTTKSVGRGTGLGLYLTHKLAESLCGRIDLESQEGVGTVFRVWLPDDSRREKRRRLAASAVFGEATPAVPA